MQQSTRDLCLAIGLGSMKRKEGDAISDPTKDNTEGVQRDLGASECFFEDCAHLTRAKGPSGP